VDYVKSRTDKNEQGEGAVLPLSDMKAVKVLAAGTMAFDAESGQVVLAEEAGPAGLEALFKPMPCLAGWWVKSHCFMLKVTPSSAPKGISLMICICWK
jgi:hypothetical protein